MELNRMKIGAAIAARRKEKGLTQEQLAARLGVSAPAVSKWETDTSYPDITLLCPLARALGTSVDALLQFEETLSDEEVVRRVNDLLTAAMNQMPDGWQAAEQQLEELLHQYPGCTALQYNAVASYDALAMFFPAAGEEARTRWRARKRQLLEEVRESGNAAYWQTATIGLAMLEITDGDAETGAAARTRWRARKRQLLEEVRESGNAAYWQTATIGLAMLEITDGDAETGAALLRQLPQRVGDPTGTWARYYLKTGQPDMALKTTQKQLYKLISQAQSLLLRQLPQRVGDPTGTWARYYLKTGQPDMALKTTQKQLYKLISQAQSLLATMMDPKLLPEPERRRAVCEAYGALARAFDRGAGPGLRFSGHERRPCHGAVVAGRKAGRSRRLLCKLCGGAHRPARLPPSGHLRPGRDREAPGRRRSQQPGAAPPAAE